MTKNNSNEQTVINKLKSTNFPNFANTGIGIKTKDM